MSRGTRRELQKVEGELSVDKYRRRTHRIALLCFLTLPFPPLDHVQTLTPSVACWILMPSPLLSSFESPNRRLEVGFQSR